MTSSIAGVAKNRASLMRAGCADDKSGTAGEASTRTDALSSAQTRSPQQPQAQDSDRVVELGRRCRTSGVVRLEAVQDASTSAESSNWRRI